MQLEVTSFCINEAAFGIGFQESSTSRLYWDIPIEVDDSDFVNICMFANEIAEKALNKRNIIYNKLVIGTLVYFYISKEEVTKYLTKAIHHV